MKSVNKSVLIWYSAQQMYTLVTDVAKYPEFLPWCDQARVIEEDAAGMTAEVGLAFSGVRQSFTTRNTHDTDRKLTMELVDGPFSSLVGHWEFQALAEDACKVLFTMEYAFSNRALEMVVGPVFNRIATSFIDSFTKRAQAKYGE